MSVYVLPQVLVFQDFSIVPAAAANPLRAHVSGGHAQLIRYADEDERADGQLGVYDRLLDAPYAWPHRPAGGIADYSYVKLWMKDALLKYFEDAIGAGSTITKLAGYNNRVASNSISFADNATDAVTYPKDTVLLDRGVKVGDVAKVRGLNSDNDSVVLWTKVKAIHGEIVPAVVNTVENDASNALTQVSHASVEQTGGAINCVTVTPDASAYDGRTSGFLSETYDVVVLQGSVNGDFSTAVVRVISGSGEDDVGSVVPAKAGHPTAIGTRGAACTFDEAQTGACSLSAATQEVSASDLIAGQRWRITVTGAFAAPTAASTGGYSGLHDTTYIVTVTRGGLFSAATPPQVKVTTINGVDLSGPTSVTASAVGVQCGTLGTFITFTGTSLCKNDRYYIVVEAAKEGPMRILELTNNIDGAIAAGSELDLTLFIRNPLLQISKNRIDSPPDTNWDVSETEITVNAGITAQDESWTDSGAAVALDVYSESTKDYGVLYVEVRYWLQDLCHEVNSIDDVGNINTAISGSLHPDNPLKWGVFKALENSNGTAVRFTSVCNPDEVESWANVLELLLGRDDVYGLVPLTRNRTVLDLYAAHVKEMSSATQGLWRVLWLNLESIPVIPIVAAGSTVPGHIDATTSDGKVSLGVVEDDAQTSGSQYTILRCTSANADFITNGVRAGDIARVLYTGDGFGNDLYSEFVVDEVHSEDQIRLITGPDAPIGTAAKFEIWRNLTATEEAQQIAVNSGSWGDRRIRATWPDHIESSGTVMEGYFLNCSLAGLVSGVLPHQGLTHLEIVGYSDVSRTTRKFNRAQLDTMAQGGVFIVTQDLTGVETTIGRIYARQAVTTGSTDDINQREESVTRNVDSISYRFKDQYKPFIGVTNVTPVMQARIELETNKLIDLLKTEAQTASLGGQLVDATIASLQPSPLFRDRYVIKINATIPYPLNNIEIHLAI